MNLPFTPDQFFSVFAQYNQAVWPAQWILNLAALGCIALLFRAGIRPDRIICAVLSALWIWMAVAYHFAFFSAINPAAWVFGAAFLLAGGGFAWFGLIKTGLAFRPVKGIRSYSGATLLVFSLVLYPLIGHLAGHRYPAAPTFGLPCPTTIFTLGMLHFCAGPGVRLIHVIPLLWSAIGSVAAFQLGVSEDLGLLAAGIVSLAFMLRPQPHKTGATAPAKPD